MVGGQFDGVCDAARAKGPNRAVRVAASLTKPRNPAHPGVASPPFSLHPLGTYCAMMAERNVPLAQSAHAAFFFRNGMAYVEPCNNPVSGGQFDFVCASARAMHLIAAYL